MPYIDATTVEDPLLRDYAVSGHRTVNGWGIGPFHIKVFLSLNHYQRQRGVSGNFLEIGAFEGRTTVFFGLMASPDERVVAIDVFEALGAHNIDRSGVGATRAAFDGNIERFGLSNRTDVIVADTMFLDFATQPSLRNIRFAHIDGGHYVDVVVNDLMKVQDLMVPGGIVAVDDWSHNHFIGVNEGCHRYLGCATPRRLVPFAVGMNKLFLTTHSHHADLVRCTHEMSSGRPIVKLHGFDLVALNNVADDPG